MDTTVDVRTPQCKEEAARIGVRHPLPFSGEWSWWLPIGFSEKLESDRDRLLEILRKIDAECQRYDGITPATSRWERIKALVSEGIFDNTTAHGRAVASTVQQLVGGDCRTCENNDADVAGDSGACVMGHGLCDHPQKGCLDYVPANATQQGRRSRTMPAVVGGLDSETKGE